MKHSLSNPTLNRLCLVYRVLDQFTEMGKKSITSTQMGDALGISSHNIRKDLSLIGEIGNTRYGYQISKLKRFLEQKLGLARKYPACIVGLGSFGSTLLKNPVLLPDSYTIVAGFDANINLLDTIQTKIPVYPSYAIAHIVEQKRIILAIIAVPEKAAQKVADTLITSGIRGIINYSAALLVSQNQEVQIIDTNLRHQCTLISAHLSSHSRKIS